MIGTLQDIHVDETLDTVLSLELVGGAAQSVRIPFDVGIVVSDGDGREARLSEMIGRPVRIHVAEDRAEIRELEVPQGVLTLAQNLDGLLETDRADVASTIEWLERVRARAMRTETLRARLIATFGTEHAADAVREAERELARRGYLNDMCGGA